MSFTEFQKETLDAVRDVVNERVAGVEQLVAKNAEQIGNLIVGGSVNPTTTHGGMNRDEYRNAAAAMLSAVNRREVTEGEVDVQQIEKYENAFTQWLRRGDAISPELRNAMSVGSDPDGGFWSPPAMSRTILSRLFETSPIRRLASTMTISEPSIEFPIDTNDLTEGGWIGEHDARAETASPQVGMQEIFLREQYANPRVTQRLLDMSSFDIAGWLADKIVDKLSRVENTAFISGAGVDRPRGILSYKDAAVTTDDASRDWGVLQYVATGAAGGFPTVSGSTSDDPDSLIDLKSKLKPDYLPNAVWMMNRSTAATLRKLKNADGDYIWRDSLVQGTPDMLLGHPVVLGEDLPDIGSNSFSVIFGDLSRYLILDHTAGVRILRDNITTKGKTKFYTTKYTGGDIRDFDGCAKLLKFGTS